MEIGPKTIASIVAGLALIGVIFWVWITIVDLRAENATLTAQIAGMNSAVAQQAAKDNAQAVADQARQDQEKAQAVADVTAKLNDANDAITRIETEAANATPADNVCPASGGLPVALTRAIDELFQGPAAAGVGAGETSGQGQGRSNTSGLQGVAGGKRTVVDIGPARSNAEPH